MNTIEQNNNSVDIASLIKKYIKYWYLFAISIIVCFILAYAYVKISKPVYVIKANLLIKQDDGKSGGIQSAMLKNFSFGGMLSGGDVDDELYIVSSHSVFKEAIKKLNLNKKYIVRKNILKKIDAYDNYPVKIDVPAGIEDTLSTTLKFKIKVSENGKIRVKVLNGKDKKVGETSSQNFPITIHTDYGNYTLNKTKDFPSGKKINTTIYLSGYDAVAENWSKSISIGKIDKKSNMIALSLKETNIPRGKDILNNIIDIYNKQGIIDKNLEAQNTAKFIEERISLIQKELFEAEQEVEKYKKENNLTDIETEAKIILEQNGDFKSKLIETETQYQIVGLIESFLKDPNNKYSLVPFSTTLSEQSSSEVVQKYNELILERMKLLRTAKENSPTVQLINSQIDATRNNVINTITNIKQSVGIALKDLKAQENKFLSRIKGMPTQEREFINIKRQQVIKEELYLFLLQKKEENALTLAVTTPKGQIVDAAYNLNKPVSPQKTIILFIGLLFGVIIPILYLYLKEVLNTKFSTKQELENITSIPILGEICETKSKAPLVVKEGDTSPIVELFRLIRTNIQFILNNKNEKVILITSSISGEGKSFFSCNLGMSLALMNKKVILVGLDIRSPKLAEYLNIKNKNIGLTNYLASENVEIKDIIITNELHNNFDIIISGPVPPNPAELLLSDRLDMLFERLKEKYDYILIDSAPVGLVSDTFCLNRIADSTIYICRANYTEKDNIKYLNQLVSNNRLKKVSLVINGTNAKQGYGYGYGHQGKK